MGVFTSKYSKGKLFDIDTKDLEYISLETLWQDGKGAEHVFPLLAIYINKKSKFGKAPVFCTSDENGTLYLVNIPKHLTEDCEEALKDDEAIQEVRDGKVGFKVYSYFSEAFNRDCLSVNFVDME